MADFRTVDGREVFLQDVGPRQRRGSVFLLSGEGMPPLMVVGSHELEPERFLEIQNREGTAYDAVTRVNLGVLNLLPERSAGDRTHIMDGGLPGEGKGPAGTPGRTSEDAVGQPGDTAVWLVSTARSRHVAVLPLDVDAAGAVEFLSEAIEGPFVVESLYGGTIRAADDLPVPGWTLYVEPLLAPSQAPGPR
jgi:hypothetical protein